VIGRPSCGFAVLVESFVGQRCLPAGERGQQGLNFGGAFPRDDALWPVCFAEDIDDFAGCFGVGRFCQQLLIEVFPEGAAGADTALVELTLGIAADAVEVVEDAGAGRAAGPSADARWPG